MFLSIMGFQSVGFDENSLTRCGSAATIETLLNDKRHSQSAKSDLNKCRVCSVGLKRWVGDNAGFKSWLNAQLAFLYALFMELPISTP